MGNGMGKPSRGAGEVAWTVADLQKSCFATRAVVHQRQLWLPPQLATCCSAYMGQFSIRMKKKNTKGTGMDVEVNWGSVHIEFHTICRHALISSGCLC